MGDHVIVCIETVLYKLALELGNKTEHTGGFQMLGKQSAEPGSTSPSKLIRRISLGIFKPSRKEIYGTETVARKGWAVEASSMVDKFTAMTRWNGIIQSFGLLAVAVPFGKRSCVLLSFVAGTRFIHGYRDGCSRRWVIFEGSVKVSQTHYACVSHALECWKRKRGGVKRIDGRA